MDIQENASLKSYNTFGINISAAYFAELNSVADFQSLTRSAKEVLILGGGSNILFTKDFEGIAIHNNIKGIEVIGDEGDLVYVKAGAGEIWHELVRFCLVRNLAGIENLSLIPGRVGAAPMQNIGAYGVELKEVFHSLEAVELSTGKVRVFNKQECEFGYRESVFKGKYKNQFAIVNVTLQLHKLPKFNTSYGAIEEELKKMGVATLSIQAISEAVCNIRRSKLPDPAVIGNAGSFFKNPTVSKEKYEELKKNKPNIVAYPVSNSQSLKLGAGWLIEQCGWKGKRIGDAGVHAKQALVLVNYGNANGKEIYELALQVRDSVSEKFGVTLETEVNIM